MHVGVDSGGTFTDVVTQNGSIEKVLSTPADPALAIGAAITERPRVLAHGTTVATNALLERRGAEVSLITNDGFADLIEIARQDRPSLYDQFADRPEPLVARSARFEVAGRLDASGDEITPIDTTALPRIATHAVAVCLLHSDLNPAHERAVAAALSGHDVSLSSEISPEFREYERSVTTVINAYLRPVLGEYLGRLSDFADDVLVMTSSGGLLPAVEAASLPVSLLLSGPAGGVRAAAEAAGAAGFANCVTFDMGGTSTDVCLVLDGTPEPAATRMLGGFPVRIPSLDIHTVGAGGGSIARIDPGGALAVGPQSAGADPGPACYGRGGRGPTVTDANLAAGRIPRDAPFPELGALDFAAAEAALARESLDAEGVISVVNANMERAIRTVTIERGHDPRDLALVAFGGAGPLHACELADSLGMPAVVIPPRAGVLSAVGILCSPQSRELVRSWPRGTEADGIAFGLDELAGRARELVPEANEVSTWLDCRYLGQSHELTVATLGDFHAEHRRRNGYERPESPIEITAIRARASTPPQVDYDSLPVPSRMRATGPAVLAEADCTVWLPDGWRAEPHPSGSWILTRAGDGR